MIDVIERVKLNNNYRMPSMMLGSYQVNVPGVLEAILRTGLECGVYGFDTSPSYGNQREFGDALQIAMRETGVPRDRIFITGKIDGWQMCRTNGAVEQHVYASMKELQVGYFDLLLVHWPFERYLANTWKCFERLYEKGVLKSIGLCNVNQRVYENFMSYDIMIKPQVIQNEISPLHCSTDDVLYFQKEELCIEAYSPLARMLPAVKDSAVLKRLSEKYRKSIAQIILKWHVQRGIVPIFTSSKPERIINNIDIFDFALSQEDMEQISGINQNYKIFPESYGCPGF